jgi:hypothetical protein
MPGTLCFLKQAPSRALISRLGNNSRMITSRAKDVSSDPQDEAQELCGREKICVLPDFAINGLLWLTCNWRF